MSLSQPPVVLITGCSKEGIGFFLAEEFAKKGCIVFASARRIEAMEGLREGIRKVALDVIDDAQVKDVVQKIIVDEGRIDILVNNAGRHCGGAVADVPIEDLKATFDVNFHGPIRLAQAVIPHMAQRKSGHIVNVGSISGGTPPPFLGGYAASKAALHLISDVMRIECAPLGIKVILAIAGTVRSNIGSTGIAALSMPPDSLYKAYYDKILVALNLSMGPTGIPTDRFAEALVKASLKSKPRPYFVFGGFVFLYRVLNLLPRSWAMYWLWKTFAD